MSYFKKQLEILEYIKKPLSIEGMDAIYKSNYVQNENVVLYSDFSTTLIQLIFDTYLGDDLTSEEERPNHFDWCWDKVINNFSNEGIEFKSTKELKDYYYDFLDIAYYQNPDKEEDTKINEGILRYWSEIFDITSVKTKAEVDVFLEIYQLFTESLFDKKTV
jgi:hypothetical protein